MSGSRKEVLLRALEAEGHASPVDPGALFASDVVGWSPLATACGLTGLTGLTGLAALASVRDDAFSNAVLAVRGLDEVGNRAFAEWIIDAQHTGPLALDENTVLQPTGRRVRLAGITVADFRDGKIRSFRTYFDDNSLIQQIIDA